MNPEEAKTERDKRQRFKNVIIFALGTLQELVDMGMVERDSGADVLTDIGMMKFHALKGKGFSPSPAEIESAVSLFAKVSCDEAREAAK